MLPLIRDHFVEVDFRARVGDIASDCVRVEEALVDLDVFKRYVLESHPWLCRAGALFVEGIQHASGPVSVGFLHLLRADVDGPPNGSVHREVLVVNVLDEPSSLISRIGLHVNSLQRPDHPHVSEGDIPDAVAVALRRHAANSHANPQHNRAILNKEVPGAILRAFGLGNHHVIPVLHGEVVEVKASSRGVDAISIEGEHDDRAFKREPLEEVDLCSRVDLNVDVVEEAVVAMVQFHVELGGVLHD